MPTSEQKRVTVTALVNGQMKTMAVVRCDNGSVSMEGDPEFVAGLQEGVLHPLSQKNILPADGMVFLDTLISVYNNPYLFAAYD